jgi:hypothetical protein
MLTTIKYLAIALAVVALVAALIAARYWYSSSTVVPVDTLAALYGGPGQAAMAAVGGLFEAGLESARLNKIAAIWTAVAAVLGAASSVVSAF